MSLLEDAAVLQSISLAVYTRLKKARLKIRLQCFDKEAQSSCCDIQYVKITTRIMTLY